MDDTQKMLRIIINGQSTFRQEVLGEIGDFRKEILAEVDKLDQKIEKVEKSLITRMDGLGKQLAYLEDDAPTREEFDNLVGRVDKLDQKATPVM